MRLVRVIFALFALAAPSLAFAQATILQGGPWAQGRVPMYVGNGFSQPTVQDSGPAGGGGAGVGLSELGITARGNGSTSAPPYVGQGTGPLGTLGCFYDGPTTGAYHYLCFSPNAQGGPLIAAGAGGGAAALPLQCIVNGVSTGCLGSSGATLINGSTVVNGGATNGLFYDNAGVLGILSTGANGVLATSSGGVPSITSTLPGGLTIPGPLSVPGVAVVGDTVNGPTWVNTILPGSGGGFTTFSAIATANSNYSAGIFATKTSLNTGTAPQSLIGLAALCNIDNTVQAQLCWAMFPVTVVQAGAVYTDGFGFETSVANYAAASAVINPFSAGNGYLVGQRIDSGTGAASNSISAYQDYVSNGGTAFVGIIDHNGSLNMASGKADFIEMPPNHYVTWFNSDNAPGWTMGTTGNAGFGSILLGNNLFDLYLTAGNAVHPLSISSTAINLNLSTLIGAGSAITSSGPGGALTTLAYTTPATGIATFLATPTSANLAAAVTNETGSSLLVFNTSPTLVTPAIAGSSTGLITIGSANAGASNFTTTLPANTGTVGELNLAQTWSALQTYSALVALTPVTIATLLAITCNSASEGDVAFVKDTVGSAAATFHLTVAGAGATTVNSLASCNGSTWQYD